MNFFEFFLPKSSPIDSLKKCWDSYITLLEISHTKQKLHDFQVLIEKMSNIITK